MVDEWFCMLDSPARGFESNQELPAFLAQTSAKKMMDRAVCPGTVLVWCSNVEPGGMERIVLSVANGLFETGWRVLLVGPFTRVPFLRQAIRPGVEFIDHEMPRTLAGVLNTAHFLERTVRDHKVDVISAHGSVFPLIFNSAPVVWTEHGVRYAGAEMLRGSRGIAWHCVRRRIERGSWKIVTVSRFVNEQTSQKLKLADGRATVIYNGLKNPAALYRLPSPQFQPPYRIGFVGRLIEGKRPLEVFELSRRLNQMGIPHIWKVFGDGVLLDAMKESLRLPGHSVQLCGLVETPEEAFSQLDVLCFHSRGEQEGLPLVLLEALAANRSVVAWDAGCNREVLAGHGILVPPPFSLDRFAASLAGALKSGVQPRVSDDRFSESRMIAGYDSILRASIRPRKTAD